MPSQNFLDLVFFETGTIFLLRVTQKFGSPSLSRLGVSRDLEIKNNATITGLGLGLVAEMNLVELGLVADICYMWIRIGVMAADMWWRIWTRIGGEYVVVVYGSDNEVGVVVVYGSSDDDDAVVIYGSGDVRTCEQNSKL